MLFRCNQLRRPERRSVQWLFLAYVRVQYRGRQRISLHRRRRGHRRVSESVIALIVTISVQSTWQVWLLTFVFVHGSLPLYILSRIENVSSARSTVIESGSLTRDVASYAGSPCFSRSELRASHAHSTTRDVETCCQCPEGSQAVTECIASGAQGAGVESYTYSKINLRRLFLKYFYGLSVGDPNGVIFLKLHLKISWQVKTIPLEHHRKRSEIVAATRQAQ